MLGEVPRGAPSLGHLLPPPHATPWAARWERSPLFAGGKQIPGQEDAAWKTRLSQQSCPPEPGGEGAGAAEVKTCPVFTFAGCHAA